MNSKDKKFDDVASAQLDAPELCNSRCRSISVSASACAARAAAAAACSDCPTIPVRRSCCSSLHRGILDNVSVALGVRLAATTDRCHHPRPLCVCRY